MSLAILASGSSGNCSLLSLHDDSGDSTHLLIDMGLSPRETNRRLAAFGLGTEDIAGILVTHFDSDHVYPGWAARLRKSPMPVHAHRRHRNRAARAQLPGRAVCYYDDAPAVETAAQTTIETALLAHDAHGTVAFIIEHRSARLGFATDLGVVPKSLFQHFIRLDALAFESNYDRQMQISSPRPAFLKRRIMGGAGHLSNDQSLEAVLRIADQSSLQHVALLHLSRQCNCPRLLQSLYAQQAGHLLDRLTISSQTQPTQLLHITSTESANTAAPAPLVGAQQFLF